MDNGKLLDYHIKATNRGFENTEKRLTKIERLMWLSIGISIGMSHIGSKLFEIAIAAAGGK